MIDLLYSYYGTIRQASAEPKMRVGKNKFLYGGDYNDGMSFA